MTKKNSSRVSINSEDLKRKLSNKTLDLGKMRRTPMMKNDDCDSQRKAYKIDEMSDEDGSKTPDSQRGPEIVFREEELHMMNSA